MAEHTSNKTPSNKPKHEKGQARQAADKTHSLWLAYRAKGGKLNPTEWKKKGMPTK